MKHNDGSFVSVHFDDFYPPDIRTAAQEDTCTYDTSDDTSEPLFKLKDIRKEINNNVENLIRITSWELQYQTRQQPIKGRTGAIFYVRYHPVILMQPLMTMVGM